MICDNDRILVGLSGGKDSVLLLYLLAKLKDFYPLPFELGALTVDPCFSGEDCDCSALEELCGELSVEYTIKRSNIWKIVFDDREEKNPCSLCAKLRRGIIHKTAKENGYNKVAFGHHADDAAETLIMNMLAGGRIECFAPVTYLSGQDIILIRPMIFTSESMIRKTVEKLGLPTVKSKCPVDGFTQRQKTRKLICDLEKDYPSLRKKLIGALQKGGISRW